MAPAGTPAPVIGHLNREIVASLAASELKERLDGTGERVIGGTPEQFGAFIDVETKRWARAVQSLRRETGLGLARVEKFPDLRSKIP